MSKRKNVSFMEMKKIDTIPREDLWTPVETQSDLEYRANVNASNRKMLEDDPKNESLCEKLTNCFKTKFGKMNPEERKLLNRQKLQTLKYKTAGKRRNYQTIKRKTRKQRTRKIKNYIS